MAIGSRSTRSSHCSLPADRSADPQAGTTLQATTPESSPHRCGQGCPGAAANGSSARLRIGTICWPSGTNASGTIFQQAIPNGIPTIVTHSNSPATRWAIASSQPSSRIQMMLPMTASAPKSLRNCVRRQRPEHVVRQPEGGDTQRDGDDQHAGDDPCDQVQQRQPPAGQHQPQNVPQRSHGPTVAPMHHHRSAQEDTQEDVFLIRLKYGTQHQGCRDRPPSS